MLYAVLTPLSWAVEDRAWLAAHVPADRGWVVPGEGDPFPSSVVPDAVVTHARRRPVGRARCSRGP